MVKKMFRVQVTQEVSLDKYVEAMLPNSSYTPLLKQVARRITTDTEGEAIKRCIDHLVQIQSIPLRTLPSGHEIEENLWGAMGCLVYYVNTPLQVEGVVAKLLTDLGHPNIPPNDKEAIFEVWPDYPCER